MKKKRSIGKRLCYSTIAALSLFALCINSLYATNNSESGGILIDADSDYAAIISQETQADDFSGIWRLDGIEVYRYTANGDSSKIASGGLPTNSITGAFSTLKFDGDNCVVRVIENSTKREMDTAGVFTVSDNVITLYVTTMPLDYTIVSKGGNSMILYHKYDHSNILYGIRLNYKK